MRNPGKNYCSRPDNCTVDHRANRLFFEAEDMESNWNEYQHYDIPLDPIEDFVQHNVTNKV